MVIISGFTVRYHGHLDLELAVALPTIEIGVVVFLPVSCISYILVTHWCVLFPSAYYHIHAVASFFVSFFPTSHPHSSCNFMFFKISSIFIVFMLFTCYSHMVYMCFVCYLYVLYILFVCR